jgi:rare lipoprotein A
MRQSLFTLILLTIASLLSSFAVGVDTEYGKAGYYADSLHGRKTASGEPYNKNDLTCAHKSLPFGTKVRITRIDNKKSVVVRVNDRGPFVEGFVTDISRQAAETIGLIRDGVTRVQLEVVEAAPSARVAAAVDGNTSLVANKPEPTSASKVIKSAKPVAYNYDPVPAKVSNTQASTSTELFKVDIKPSLKAGFGVQVSTLNNADNVIPILKQLQVQWPDKALVLVQSTGNDKNSIYKVIIGPYPDKKSAEAQQKLAVKRKFKDCFVVYLGDM